MQATITPFRPAPEALDFDHDALAAICRTHGAEAEAVIAETLAEIETRLSTLRDGPAGRAGLGREAEALLALGQRIGMRNLVVAAEALGRCLAAGDAAGLAAARARLVRLAEPERARHWHVQTDNAG
ncbi:hypothetical protein [Jannaschia ovalis]|uniref:Hpt domain-containing protein n=1 Tax=Jannaschia ovalis TaxID=3038773 RepID=A0ABY8L7P2_9RHOB|nr:hypothetical protein [Jannaschia sp. GRR-S6-38]WGH77397.1 hypothetical protein P8627_10090 [Jannaschia sp. GRR-S6-38]